MSSAKFLYSYTQPYRLKIILAVIFMLASSGLNTLPPLLFKYVVDDVLISRNIFILNVICVSVILIFGLKAITMYLQRYYMNEAGQGVVMDIRNALYNHMLRMKLGYIYSSRAGDLMSRITSDAATLQNIVTSTFIDMMFNLLTFMGMFAFIIYINWRLTMLIVCVLPFVGLLLSIAGKRLRLAGHNVQEHLADITATAQEAFTAVRVVRSFANEDAEMERFREAGRGNYAALLQAVSVQGILSGVIELFLIIALAVVFRVGGMSVIDGELTPGELISFTGYIAFMVQPIRSVMNQMSYIQTGIASAERIQSILATPTEDDTPGHEHIAVTGAITFRNVSFSYDAQEILHGISLDVNAGGKIAIVGPTGSGKSTIADLLPRFYEPSSGEILIDGRNIHDFGLKDLRQQIGIVPQECILMRGTIAFNIAYGMSDIDIERVRNAAEIADISAFIESLPEGYDTVVGERGVTLSGGQRQRIAIARAVIRDPRILILDEATSSLDTASEQAVQKALNQAMKGRTSIIIAHRLSTIKNADKIYVLSEGKFLEAGTHEELLLTGGLYAQLYGNV